MLRAWGKWMKVLGKEVAVGVVLLQLCCTAPCALALASTDAVPFPVGSSRRLISTQPARGAWASPALGRGPAGPGAWGIMRLRGGNGDDNFWFTLRELLGSRRGQTDEPSLAGIVLDSLSILPPTTRALVVLNVAIYILARLGGFGSEPAERLGFRAKDVLAHPRGQAYKLLTAAFLHLNHAHIASNMVVLASVGRQLESRLGSRRLAALIAFLVPVVGRGVVPSKYTVCAHALHICVF